MKILFQGDSITDGAREKTCWFFNYGCGYPCVIGAQLSKENPGKMEIINRGVGGNRISDLYARMKVDCWNFNPDIISILVGVNDVWHKWICNDNGVDAEKYFDVYDMLIKHTLSELPNVKIVIMEPFVLKSTATAENYEEFRKEVEQRAQMAKKIAEKYSLLFVPLQEDFDNALEKAPAEYWLADGVHPALAGSQLIADKWTSLVKEQGWLDIK